MTKSAKQANKSRTPTRKAKSKTRTKIACALCKKAYVEITADHLREHGYTPEMYRRVFALPLAAHRSASRANYRKQPLSHDDVVRNPELRSLAQSPRLGGHDSTLSGLAPEVVTALANHVRENPEYLAPIADDVSRAIISGPQRHLFSQGLCALIMSRLTMHANAVARLIAINQELQQPWRVSQGGQEGGPTPTKDLIALHAAANIEVGSAESLLLKAVKLAADEKKTEPGSARDLNPLDRYRGDGELLPGNPEELPPSQREIVRQLMGALAKGARAQGQVIEAKMTPIQQVIVKNTPKSGNEPLSPPIELPLPTPPPVEVRYEKPEDDPF